MVQLNLDEIPVGHLKAKEASVRPRSVFALVTLTDKGVVCKLRLDLGKSVFIDHVDLHEGAIIDELPPEDVRVLTQKIIDKLRSEKHAEAYNKTPVPLHVVRVSPPA